MPSHQPSNQQPDQSQSETCGSDQPSPLERLARIESYTGLPDTTRAIFIYGKDQLPEAWPNEGDYRIALACCMASPMIRILGKWYKYVGKFDALDEPTPDPAGAASNLAPEYWQPLSELLARNLFPVGMAALGIDVNVPGSRRVVDPIWSAAKNLAWGRQDGDSPMVAWLQTSCEVDYVRKGSSLATEELCTKWSADHPGDKTGKRALAMRLSASVESAWPGPIKTGHVRHSTNLPRGSSHVRGWIGIRFRNKS